EWNFPSVLKGYFTSWFSGKNMFYDDLIVKYSLDAVYPANSYPVKNRTNAKIIAWYADLQHKYYPEFFSKLTILHRNIRIYLMLKNASDLIVSSRSVKNDFIKFYKLRKDLKIHIYHFTSVNDDYPEISINDLRSRYNLPEKYYLVSNQFHKHKNHKVLLQSIAKLKAKGIHRNLAMTGKLPSAGDSPYLGELHRIIEDDNLQDQIYILGVIPREDQLSIMSHAEAVIQPSLFEGWSTVIEDAMSLQVPVIASNLDVNIEQVGDKGTYFDPFDPDELASILEDFPERDKSLNLYGDYKNHIKESAEIIMDVFSK
ncbi:MAG: glycosyltransferase family 4 protein, partial [Bacteroidales bacterium]|nr:glycosyltransferase family 4 protein [Bacteroidales bacterium]